LPSCTSTIWYRKIAQKSKVSSRELL